MSTVVFDSDESRPEHEAGPRAIPSEEEQFELLDLSIRFCEYYRIMMLILKKKIMSDTVPYHIYGAECEPNMRYDLINLRRAFHELVCHESHLSKDDAFFPNNMTTTTVSPRTLFDCIQPNKSVLARKIQNTHKDLINYFKGSREKIKEDMRTDSIPKHVFNDLEMFCWNFRKTISDLEDFFYYMSSMSSEHSKHLEFINTTMRPRSVSLDFEYCLKNYVSYVKEYVAN